MKWSDIKKSFAKKNHEERSVAASIVNDGSYKKPFPWKALLFGIVAMALIATAVVVMIKIFGKKQVTPVLPSEELHAIGTFLKEHPPQPLTNAESSMVEKTLAHPASLNENDTKALQEFLHR